MMLMSISILKGKTITLNSEFEQSPVFKNAARDTPGQLSALLCLSCLSCRLNLPTLSRLNSLKYR
jgi:hypothetical protein